MVVEDLCELPLLYIILTHSGKPVFYSSGTEEEIVRYTGVIQAIVACFDKPNDLRTLESDSTLFVVQDVFPLILVAIDRTHRSATQLRSHLELFHAQILSVLTKQQLEKQFAAKPGIDLRPMLGGTEVFLKALVRNVSDCEPWSWLGALESLELHRSVRSTLNEALFNSRAQSSLLYGFMVSNSQISGVLRPKQHSLHPPDLHLVFSMLFNTSVFRDGEHWVPICFPKFNPNGFLYAYIRLITPPHTYLILVSPNRTGFFEMQKVGNDFMSNVGAGILENINQTVLKGRIDCSSIGIEPIQYFVYKSCSHVQFIQSTSTPETPQNIKLLFAQLQASMSSKRQRICWSKTEGGNLLGWHTPAFELYAYSARDADESQDSKSSISEAVKRLVSWIRKRETKLFIVDGATF